MNSTHLQCSVLEGQGLKRHLAFFILLQNGPQALLGSQLQDQTHVRAGSHSTQLGQVGMIQVGQERDFLSDFSVSIEQVLWLL